MAILGHPTSFAISLLLPSHIPFNFISGSTMPSKMPPSARQSRHKDAYGPQPASSESRPAPRSDASTVYSDRWLEEYTAKRKQLTSDISTVHSLIQSFGPLVRYPGAVSGQHPSQRLETASSNLPIITPTYHPGESYDRNSLYSGAPAEIRINTSPAGRAHVTCTVPRVYRRHGERRPCAGITLLKEPCGNRASAAVTATLGDDDEWRCYCHVLTKARLPQARARSASVRSDWDSTVSQVTSVRQLPNREETSYRAPERGGGGFWSAEKWVAYDEWIPKGLSSKTKSLLQKRMREGPSPSDRDGFVYCYEIWQDDEPGYVHLKIGRSNDVFRRMNEWRRKCGTENIVLGWFPGMPDAASLSEKGWRKAQAEHRSTRMGKHVNMAERLAHLELKDLAENYPRAPCDCGTNHREIFTFKVGKGRKEPWEEIVKPVIERWTRFVEMYTY